MSCDSCQEVFKGQIGRLFSIRISEHEIALLKNSKQFGLAEEVHWNTHLAVALPHISEQYSKKDLICDT